MNFQERMREIVVNATATKEETWLTFQKHSAEYADALGLSTHDLSIIEDQVQGRLSMYPDLKEVGSMGFLKFDLHGEKFSLSVKHVCGMHYGGQWQDFVFAICMSDLKRNQQLGYGTTLISVLPSDWHEKILFYLKTGGEVSRHLMVVPRPAKE